MALKRHARTAIARSALACVLATATLGGATAASATTEETVAPASADATTATTEDSASPPATDARSAQDAPTPAAPEAAPTTDAPAGVKVDEPAPPAPATPLPSEETTPAPEPASDSNEKPGDDADDEAGPVETTPAPEPIAESPAPDPIEEAPVPEPIEEAPVPEPTPAPAPQPPPVPGEAPAPAEPVSEDEDEIPYVRVDTPVDFTPAAPEVPSADGSIVRMTPLTPARPITPPKPAAGVSTLECDEQAHSSQDAGICEVLQERRPEGELTSSVQRLDLSVAEKGTGLTYELEKPPEDAPLKVRFTEIPEGLSAIVLVFEDDRYQRARLEVPVDSVAAGPGKASSIREVTLDIGDLTGKALDPHRLVRVSIGMETAQTAPAPGESGETVMGIVDVGWAQSEVQSTDPGILPGIPPLPNVNENPEPVPPLIPGPEVPPQGPGAPPADGQGPLVGGQGPSEGVDLGAAPASQAPPQSLPRTTPVQPDAMQARPVQPSSPQEFAPSPASGTGTDSEGRVRPQAVDPANPQGTASDAATPEQTPTPTLDAMFFSPAALRPELVGMLQAAGISLAILGSFALITAEERRRSRR